ncbi:MAG: bifunctional proline dehydrogenase/L-glutamate gamma-semialdehyde dehydrogenase PutA [Pseudomonadales bacterium]
MTHDLLSELRTRIRRATHADEAEVVSGLITAAQRSLDPERRRRVLAQARDLTARCREHAGEAGTLDAFLQEFGLSNPEGVALMCLAEALLRVPDDDTADRLIAEKIRAGDWSSHLGRSESLFVNGSVWGLMLTGRLVTLDPAIEADTGRWVRRLVSRVGEPIVRAAVMQAMRILGRQYVLGRDIEEALERAGGRADTGDLYSFDMLGEGARTWEDADRYFTAYRDAIIAIGATADADDPARNHGISIKLSALHPRFEAAQQAAVLAELPERLEELAGLARDRKLGFSIDAEEAARLDLTMTLFEQLARAPALAGWEGLGFVLQAYQKRAPLVADWLIALAGSCDRRLMVRLVKGAYWDAEIKHAQVQGFADYPVYTRKPNTDLCYEVCAARLLDGGDRIYPQFATHNASTACQVLELGRGRQFELQRLHGMGELLYDELFRGQGGPRAPLRVYAPVGSHQDLLPYLVRRLLENGANSSFVNRFLDDDTPLVELIRDPLAEARRSDTCRHAGIPTPPGLYRFDGEDRDNSAGLDLDDADVLADLVAARAAAEERVYASQPLPVTDGTGAALDIRSPSQQRRIIGRVQEASEADVEVAIAAARAAQPAWNRQGAQHRAAALERAAALMEQDRVELMYLLGAEAGRTVADALAEVREAADFCRYYAMQCRRLFADVSLPGPTGEDNVLSLHGRGLFACISPWNFPLAIFTGQIAAALAAGNGVLAKPAEQTPLIAARAVALLHEAGVPADLLALLPGAGERIGPLLTADERVDGIVFTGSTDTARTIQRSLAARSGPIATLIAETGGQNVMITDSTALPEQLVDDVIDSAFRSAGQRCSALRVLYLQEDIADKVTHMLEGAMSTLVIGDPLDPATDVGPVIDDEARAGLERHVTRLEERARLICRLPLPDDCADGTFFPPQAFEIGSILELDGEVFGPVLHIIRYRPDALDRIIEEINATGYGLTLGVHSRIEGFAREIFARVRVGNTYVNRNMIGAVVGVQPFGGEGLSGTGPKAGGPNYLPRFAVERTYTDNVVARGGNAALFELDEP